MRAAVVGGVKNIASSNYAFIGGGYGNNASSVYSLVGGGQYNEAKTNTHATVGGGYQNTASGQYSFVGGGWDNDATTSRSFVGGGYLNLAGGTYATVAGGRENIASGIAAFVGAGQDNNATNLYTTIPGGFENIATQSYAFAAGRRARANQSGSFVWGDGTADYVGPNATNQFVVQADGGALIYSQSDLSSGVWLAPGSGTWASVSDRNKKENFEVVDSKDILQKISEIPITEWNYKSQDASIRHLGPMAQDFYEKFGLGESDRLITTLDIGGVALAAIQGTYNVIQEQEKEISELKAENQELRELIKDIDNRLSEIEQR